MKALTLWQPWASLVMIGAKPYEFREWDYSARGMYRRIVDQRIVMHAGARPIRPSEVQRLLADCRDGGGNTGLIVEKAVPFLERLAAAAKCQGVIPLGAGLGTVRVGKPRNAGGIFGGLPHDSDRGDFNYAWPCTEIEVWEEPIPMRGLQGFWDWPTIALAAGRSA